MVSLNEIQSKELASLQISNVNAMIAILRDLNFATFMGIPIKLYAIKENDTFAGVLYRTHDSNESKNIVVLLSFSQEIVEYLEATIAGSTTMFSPLVQRFSNMPYMDGGVYHRTCRHFSNTDKSYTQHYSCIPTLSCAKEIISSASLPTNDVDKYIAWLDWSSDKYVALDDEKIVSILCILKKPVNIVSFYWDSDKRGSGIARLINYCSPNYKELFAMAPKERHKFLAQNEFSCTCNWRLFYNGI